MNAFFSATFPRRASEANFSFSSWTCNVNRLRSQWAHYCSYWSISAGRTSRRLQPVATVDISPSNFAHARRYGPLIVIHREELIAFRTSHGIKVTSCHFEFQPLQSSDYATSDRAAIACKRHNDYSATALYASHCPSVTASSSCASPARIARNSPSVAVTSASASCARAA